MNRNSIFTISIIILALSMAFYFFIPYNPQNESEIKLFSRDELKSSISGKLMLSICGKVFDVTRGHRYYGPKGGYSFFVGTDGTKAFSTGDFDEDLTDNIDDLPLDHCLAVEKWEKFFIDHKNYPQIGILKGGYFYDEKGKETEGMKKYRKCVEDAHEKEIEKHNQGLSPSNICLHHWSIQTNRHRFWCENQTTVPRLAAQIQLKSQKKKSPSTTLKLNSPSIWEWSGWSLLLGGCPSPSLGPKYTSRSSNNNNKQTQDQNQEETQLRKVCYCLPVSNALERSDVHIIEGCDPRSYECFQETEGPL